MTMLAGCDGLGDFEGHRAKHTDIFALEMAFLSKRYVLLMGQSSRPLLWERSHADPLPLIGGPVAVGQQAVPNVGISHARMEVSRC